MILTGTKKAMISLIFQFITNILTKQKGMLKNTWTQGKKKNNQWKDKKQRIRKVVECVKFNFEYGKRPELTSFFQLFEEGPCLTSAGFGQCLKISTIP